ncbi:unnamed protein product [Chrysoparadoxa australica]
MLSPPIAPLTPWCLVGTSCAAQALESGTRVGASLGGAFMSFGFMSVLSNVGLVTAEHPVYAICWEHLLPMSLSCIVLASNFGSPLREDSSSSPGLSSVSRVGLAFGIGAAGSLLGTLAGYAFATRAPVKGVRLDGPIACKVAACLLATAIGGSVNMASVASALKLPPATFGALAAADILVMALYFAMLLFGRRISWLQRFLPASSMHKVMSRSSQAIEAKEDCRRLAGLLPAAMALSVAWLISGVARRCEKLLPVPGSHTILVAALSVGLSKHAGLSAVMRSHGAKVGSLLLACYFGAVGASCRLKQASAAGPAVLLFSTITVMVHMTCIVAGSAALNRFLGSEAPPAVELDDAIIGSNALIGGPATAGGFANLIGRPDLVLPGSVWGTVGYTTATTLGIWLHRLLR